MEFMKKVNEISKFVGKTATETYNTVADKSGKLIEDAKLKLSVSEKETDIEAIYETMGKTVYDMYKKEEDVGKVFEKECKKIDKIKSEIDEMNKKILYNKGLRTCEKCGNVISTDCVFCAHCGTKQKAVKIKDEKKTSKDKNEKEKKVSEKVCPQCGLICIPEDKFCNKCGYEFK